MPPPPQGGQRQVAVVGGQHEGADGAGAQQVGDHQGQHQDVEQGRRAGAGRAAAAQQQSQGQQVAQQPRGEHQRADQRPSSGRQRLAVPARLPARPVHPSAAARMPTSPPARRPQRPAPLRPGAGLRLQGVRAPGGGGEGACGAGGAARGWRWWERGDAETPGAGRGAPTRGASRCRAERPNARRVPVLSVGPLPPESPRADPGGSGHGEP